MPDNFGPWPWPGGGGVLRPEVLLDQFASENDINDIVLVYLI
jgi:hypothetical protein